MSNLHKSFRKVLGKSKATIEGVPVTLVTWCVVEKENSRSIYTKHVAVTAYCGVKNTGTSARFPDLDRIEKKAPKVEYHQMLVNEAASDAYLASLESKDRTGTIKWFDRGCGFVKDDATGKLFPIYACNVEGANHSHHELVTNIKLDKGMRVKFDLGDKFTIKNCGATNIRIAA